MGNVIETHKHAGDFKEASASVATTPEFYQASETYAAESR